MSPQNTSWVVFSKNEPPKYKLGRIFFSKNEPPKYKLGRIFPQSTQLSPKKNFPNQYSPQINYFHNKICS